MQIQEQIKDNTLYFSLHCPMNGACLDIGTAHCKSPHSFMVLHLYFPEKTFCLEICQKEVSLPVRRCKVKQQIESYILQRNFF